MATTSIAAKPLPGTAYWTAFAEFEGDSGPADPLRFDMYTQRLGNILLPGITNRTERARYLSMVCAGLVSTQRPGASVREVRRAFLPFERGWALAMTLSADGRIKLGADSPDGGRGLKPEYRGFRGANRALRYYRTLEGKDTLRPSGYVLLQGQESQGGLGAYLVTLRQFGFVHPDTLAVTALGRSLAEAFTPKGTRKIHLGMLAEDGSVARHDLRRLGEHVTLARSSNAEREIVRRAVFASPRSTAGELLRRIDAADPTAATSEDRLRAIARADGDHLERAAAFAVAFDPLRIAALRLFSTVGAGLVTSSQDKASMLTELHLDTVDADAAETRTHAATVAALPAPVGLDAIAGLARECASGRTAEDTVRSIVAYHRREQRSWIVAEGKDRYRLGRHGPFDLPAHQFNGYTLGRAVQLRDDVQAAA